MSRRIGLDVHREFAQIAVWEDGVVRQAGRIATTPEAIRVFADSLLATDEVAIEATCNTHAIVKLLERRVARVVISNPMKTRAIAEAKVKTDKVDAAILAQLLAADYLPPVLTIPGIDATVALSIVAAVGDFGRFHRPERLVSYLGLNPRVKQSGNQPASHGRITKHGRAHARGMLVEAAWVAVRTLAPFQLLGEHHDDPAGAADIGELVDVSVGRYAAQRVTAVPRGGLERLIDVVNREGDAVHADLIRLCGLGFDRVGMDVLEEFEATAAVWRLEHGDVGVVAVEAHGGVGPLATNRVATEDGQTKIGKERDCRLEVTDGDTDILEFDGHPQHATDWGVSSPERAIETDPPSRTTGHVTRGRRTGPHFRFGPPAAYCSGPALTAERRHSGRRGWSFGVSGRSATRAWRGFASGESYAAATGYGRSVFAKSAWLHGRNPARS